MSLIANAGQILREEGLVSLGKKGTEFVYNKARQGIEKRRYNIQHQQKHIFESDWETLIILDACRYDLWKQVAGKTKFLQEAHSSSVHSPASSSREWMQANFTNEYNGIMEETAYVTANPFTQDHANRSEFALLDEVWKYGWDDSVGVVPPDVVTDRAIDVARSDIANRLLIHYMQPHFPSLRQPELGSRIDPEKNSWISSIWEKLEAGEIDQDTVWQAYQDNLRDVLKSVELLLRNHNSQKVIITSDHGNGFGEAEIYGHPGERTHRVLREVPYCVTKATDKQTYMPEQTRRDIKKGDSDIEERLAALGYRETK